MDTTVVQDFVVGLGVTGHPRIGVPTRSGTQSNGAPEQKAVVWRGISVTCPPWMQVIVALAVRTGAGMLRYYNRLLRKQKAGTATLDELHTLSILLPYMELVHRGEGAPTFDLAPHPGHLLRGPSGGGVP